MTIRLLALFVLIVSSDCGWKYNPITYGNCMVKPCKVHCDWMRLISVCMRSAFDGFLFKLECKRLAWMMRLRKGAKAMEEQESAMVDEWYGHQGDLEYLEVVDQCMKKIIDTGSDDFDDGDGEEFNVEM